MAERHPGWVNNITASDARLASGLLVAAHGAGDALGPLRVRTGIRDATGYPGLVTLGTNKVTVNAFQAVIADPAQPGDGAFLVTMDTQKELPIDPQSERDYRVDLVVAEVIEAEPGFRVSVYPGTYGPTDPPPRPAVANPRSLVLAEIKVPPTSKGSPAPTDTRRFTSALNGVLPVLREADRPANPPGSMIIYRMDAGVIEVTKNGVWTPYRPPRGSVDTWQQVTFIADRGWSHYATGSSDYAKAGFTITEDGWVHLRGLIKGGLFEQAFTHPIFTFPPGYRPVAHHLFPVACVATGWAPTMGRVDILPTGAYAVTGANGWLSLDGISFPTY